MNFRFLILMMSFTCISGCGPSYSPDTYASNAAQQANKVEQGVIVGVRDVAVSAAGTVGTLSGAAAGGIAGSQVGVGPISAFSALGGSLVGGLAGSTAEHVTADTLAFEYIVRKPNGDLVSVTQKDKTPLVLGQKVLVIAGVQARVVADYTVPPPAKPAAVNKTEAAATGAKPTADLGGATPPGGSAGPAVDAIAAVTAVSAEAMPANPQPAAIAPAGPPPGMAIVSRPAEPAGSVGSPAP